MDQNIRKKKGTPAKNPAIKPSSVPKSVPTPAQNPRPLSSGNLFWIHLGLTALVLLILRLSFLDLPLERDESAYAYLGKRASEGLAPYRDFYEMKPPLLFYGYSLLNLIFGYSEVGLRWAACFLTLLMCGGVYLIGRSWFGAKYGFVAALALAVFSSSPRVSMVFAESELLVMSLVLFGIWFLSRLLNESASPRHGHVYLITAGALLGAGVMIKQSAVFFLGFAAIVLVLLATGNTWREKLVTLIRQGLWFSLGAIAPVLLCLAIVFGFGVWEEFAFWNLEYPRLYTQNESESTPELNLLQANFTKLIEQQVLLWVCAGFGVLATVLRGLKLKGSIALLAFALFSFLSITPGQRYYLHYWIQLVPALTLLIAHLFFQLEKLGERPGLGFIRSLSLPAAGLVLLLVAGLSSSHWRSLDSTTVMKEMFRGNPFVEDEQLARLIEAQIQPDESVAVLGTEPQVYIYLNRKAPTRHFYTAFLSRNHRFSKSWQTEAMEDLRAAKPEYVVFYILPVAWMMRPDSEQLFYQSSYAWVNANYSPIAWVDYTDYYNPTLITDAAASSYQPQSSAYIMVMKKKG